MELKATRYEVTDRIATLTLARPHRHNAWTGRMHTEYRWCLAQAEADPDVRAVIVTGAGDDFCVGADAAALEGHVAKGGYDPGTPDDLPMPGYGRHPELDAHFAFQFALDVPVIAAVNGPAAGVGLVVACFADLRFAASGVKLATAHGRLGLPAEYGLSWLLPRLIGAAAAADLLLSGRIVRAEEAGEMGLFTSVVPPDELMATVDDYVRTMIDTVAPSSLAATKRQFWLDQHRTVAASVADADRRMHEMMRGAEYAEGVAAFLEKRPPRW